MGHRPPVLESMLVGMAGTLACMETAMAAMECDIATKAVVQSTRTMSGTACHVEGEPPIGKMTEKARLPAWLPFSGLAVTVAAGLSGHPSRAACSLRKQTPAATYCA